MEPSWWEGEGQDAEEEVEEDWLAPVDAGEAQDQHQRRGFGGATEEPFSSHGTPILDKQASSSCSTSSSTSAEGTGIMTRMELNTFKAGMEGLDKEKINRVIMEASKGSRFYENEMRKEKQVAQRIAAMMDKLASITPQQTNEAQVQVDKMVEDLVEARDLSRTIVHIDMDAFYAAVEMRDNPTLRDKPMAVGGIGMLSTSNYLARKYGVRAAMPGFIGKKLCPDLVIVPSNFDKYRTVSSQVRDILAQYDPNFAPMSLDEAYMDLTDYLELRKSLPEEDRTFYIHVEGCVSKRDAVVENHKNDKMSEQTTQDNMVLEEPDIAGIAATDNHEEGDSVEEPVPYCKDGEASPPDSFEADASTDGPKDDAGFKEELVGDAEDRRCATIGCEKVVFGCEAEDIVREIRFRIEQRTRLTASAGIAPNVMLAKVCSDQNKPNGQFRIPADIDAIRDFIRELPVRKVCGIGKVMAQQLNALGISTCTHLYDQRVILSLLFSPISSSHLLRVALGLGATRIERESERKSMSVERTFSELYKSSDLYRKCWELCEALAKDLQDEGLKGRTVTIKLKTVNFEVKQRGQTVPRAVSSMSEIYEVAEELLKMEILQCQPQPLRLRLMGVRLSNFLKASQQDQKQGSITSFLRPRQDGHMASTADNPSSTTSQAQKQPTTIGDTSTAIDNDPPLPCLATAVNSHQKEIPDQVYDHHHKHYDIQECSEENTAVSFEKYIPAQGTLSYTGGNTTVTEQECHLAGRKSTAASYECPVCGEPQPDNLRLFNEHVDMCLVMSASVKQTEERETAAYENMVTGNKLEMEEKHELDIKCPQITDPGVEDRVESVECPVCGQPQSGELLTFNHHVDMCLSRGAIRDIIKEQGCSNFEAQKPSCSTISTNKAPKRSASHTGSSAKRRKQEKSSKTATLDRFFV